MRQPWVWVACCCAVLTACGGSTPTGPSTSPTLSRTRFLAFGDSMTAGEVTAPVGGVGLASPNFKMVVIPTASYPSQLLSLAQARYATQAAVVSVINAGRPGETVQEGAARFPDVFFASQADVVLLLEGVNGLSYVGPDLSTEFMRTMVQAARTRGARVFVGSMVPTITGRQRSQVPSELEAYNAKLQLMARAEEAAYVDLYNALLAEANTVIGVDGLHPTEAGYRRIADVFFAAIQANLENK
ncbi:MAG: GDSL-type esterase/lipase family protein [Acidobacteriota bacterium]|nr:GDSL-type esterase/lipase family protein [Acidobacteriota bacterium]